MVFNSTKKVRIQIKNRKSNFLATKLAPFFVQNHVTFGIKYLDNFNLYVGTYHKTFHKRNLNGIPSTLKMEAINSFTDQEILPLILHFLIKSGNKYRNMDNLPLH